MVDELYDRSFQAGRAELNKGILTLARKLRDVFVPAFTALHRIEWDAPWKAKPSHKAQA